MAGIDRRTLLVVVSPLLRVDVEQLERHSACRCDDTGDVGGSAAGYPVASAPSSDTQQFAGGSPSGYSNLDPGSRACVVHHTRSPGDRLVAHPSEPGVFQKAGRYGSEEAGFVGFAHRRYLLCRNAGSLALLLPQPVAT